MKLILLVSLLLYVFPGLISQLKAATNLEGLWLLPTGHLIVAIEQQQLSFYEVTYSDKDVGSNASCYRLSKQQLQDPLAFYLPVDIERYFLTAQQQLSFIDHGALYNPKLQSIKQLPDQCAKHRTFNAAYQHRPVIDLDIVWNAFSQYYGFLALRGISAQQWRAKYEQYKTRALHTKNAKQLFSLLSELLEYAAGEKNVAGVIIQADDHVEMQAEQFNWDYQVNKSNHYSRRRAVLNNPEKTYLSEYLETDGQLQKQSKRLLMLGDIWGVVSYFGKIKQENIGYLQLNSMLDFASLNGRASTADYQKLARACEHFMQQVMTIAKQQGYRKIIIDVRNNFGGFDQISLLIASYFNDTQRPVFSKQQRVYVGSEQLQWSTAYRQQLASQQDYFRGDIVLLTSKHTVSAAEVFAMAMDEIPRVTIIGETTTGSFSDVSSFHTSNGWFISMSTELYRKIAVTDKEKSRRTGSEKISVYDNSPEGVGIIPHIAVKYLGTDHYPLLSLFATKQDSALEQAIRH